MYTAEGFEILSSPGVAGAVRRNYIYRRNPPRPVTATPNFGDRGQGQSCTEACRQFGKGYGPNAGRALHYRDASGNIQPDGIGDMASLAYFDYDFYHPLADNSPSIVTAGIWGRPLNYHESDVAQADFCCCQIILASSPEQRKACIDFEKPFVAGTKYGSTAGHNPGDQAFSSNGISATVDKFTSTNGNTYFGEALIDGAAVGGLSGQSLRLNNINIVFDFTALPFKVGEVTFEFADLGGTENLVIDGTSSYAGDIKTSPPNIGNAQLSVVTSPIAGGSAGKASVLGGINTLAIGGQEFWIDQVCAID